MNMLPSCYHKWRDAMSCIMALDTVGSRHVCLGERSPRTRRKNDIAYTELSWDRCIVHLDGHRDEKRSLVEAFPIVQNYIP